jgi:solute carrier family 25 (adenine nucleotide translocator) protein 4/5/6/31
MSQQQDLVKYKINNILLGACAATILKTAKAPCERIKFLLQCQNELKIRNRDSEPFKGIINCTKRILRSEGFFSLWRGNLAACLNYFPKQGIYILVLEDVKTIFKPSTNEGYAINFVKTIASGSAAGAITLTGMYPLDYVRTQLAVDVKQGDKGYQYKGITDVIIKTWKKNGIFGLYRGYLLSCFGMMVYRGCYFGLYDILKPSLGKTPKLYESFALGYGVVLTSGFLCYPIDTVKRRLLVASMHENKYNGAFDCFKKIILNEGVLSLMNGFGASLLTAIFGTCILVGYNTYLQPIFKVKALSSD